MSPREAIADTFRSLRVRNYRLFTGAQLVSLIGTWAQVVAQNWLVLKLTGSGVALGIVTALQFLPTALGGMWAGLLADRFDKRKILMWTQGAAGALALILWALTATGSVRLWMVYVLALLLGVVTAADTPARQAFVYEMVGPGEIANAVGLNSAVFNTARIVGPALAAGVIAAFGIPSAFLLNGLTYFGPVVALALMDTRALHRSDPAPRARGMLREGLDYVWRTRDIRRTLAVLIVVSTMGFNFTVTIPLMAKFTFAGTINAYAVLLGLLAGGGLLGGLWAAHRARPTQRLLAGAAAAFGAFAIGASVAPSVLTAGVMLAFAGAASMAFIATANSTLQLSTPALLRGRVMAIYALVFLGSTPFGSLVFGWISEHFGARVGIAAGAAASLAAGLVAMATLAERARRPHRPEPQAA